MSHYKERTEKDCLNCGAWVAGRFCQVCGQENVEMKETFWHLLTHFFNDITHYDGKFFSTVRLLLLKPGFLTAEYVRGRRMAYLHPIRMYVFTSAFFFLLYFSFFSSNPEQKYIKEEQASLEQMHHRLQEMRAVAPDSLVAAAIDSALQKSAARIAVLHNKISKMATWKQETADSRGEDTIDSTVNPVGETLYSTPETHKDRLTKNNISYDLLDFEFYQDLATYEAIQKELPEEKKHGFASRILYTALLQLNEKHVREQGKVFEKIQDKFNHYFPKLLFISLPIFAWLLKMLYIRHKYYYASHGIFAIHAYCGVFLLMLLYYTLDSINSGMDWKVLSWLEFLLSVYMMYYIYKAMRNFYEQSRLKTLLKYAALSIMTSITMLILIVIFGVISAYNI